MPTDKKQAFAGRTDVYQKARPNYPLELFIALIDFWKKDNPASTIVPTIADIGCGTGIATRGIYAAFDGYCKVIGIEPGHEMHKQAIDSTPDNYTITFLEGSAENIPLTSNTIDIVIAAQAIQWFDRDLFYHETKRILKPRSVISIIENNRDYKSSQFLDEYENFLEQYAQYDDGRIYSRHYRDHDYKSELQLHFIDAIQIAFPWIRYMATDKFLEMVKSSTQAQRAIKNLGMKKVEQSILALAAPYCNQNGLLEIPYVSMLYAAKSL